MDKKNKQKYPLMTYLAILLVVVISIVILSYFVQQRNREQQDMRLSQIQAETVREEQISI